MDNGSFETRRRFLKLALAGAFAGVSGQVAWGGKLVALEETDPMAIALAYHADAANVDPTKQSSFLAGSTCANCVQYKAADEQTGACALFPGKVVNAKGWCKTWVKK